MKSMSGTEETLRRLAAVPSLQVSTCVPLSRYTRFGIGGPADIFAETCQVEAFIAAMNIARSSGLDFVVIGGGTNLIVSDAGFRGVVLRFVADRLMAAGNRVVTDAGVVLQDLIDFAIERGLKGIETLAGIPGWVGAAVYGNAGAYGHSLSERVHNVRFLDNGHVRVFNREQCDFHYRESIFKVHKEWIIFSAELILDPADAEALRRRADDILKIRNEKFPPTMKCAGSIFKNFLLAELPREIAVQVPLTAIREGKVPAAYFLEQVGAKGMVRGDIHVAGYHANLIYNAGSGTARDLCDLIDDLKARVRERFDMEVEEEVQYVGFPDPHKG
jgi:UDP-N-acetylmuramate dehydrogenase